MKWKKLVSPSKKQTLVITEEPAKKPIARRQPTGVQIKDTPGMSVSKKKTPAHIKRNKGIDFLYKAALFEEAQMNKAIKWSKWETHMHQASGSGDRAGVQPKDPDEPKGKSINTHEATVIDDDDDVQQSDDEITKSDDDKSVDLHKIDDKEEIQEDEFVHTTDDYVPMDDETNDVDDEEYDGINKEMYDDVNVELKDAEFADEGKGDKEMTNADKVNAELKEVNQEVASALVQNEAQATTVAA
ncbi:hypothetical protein Tco_1206444 [Tanacetum coccineum]